MTKKLEWQWISHISTLWEIYCNTFWQKFRESNIFIKEVTKEFVSRNIFWWESISLFSTLPWKLLHVLNARTNKNFVKSPLLQINHTSRSSTHSVKIKEIHSHVFLAKICNSFTKWITKELIFEIFHWWERISHFSH